MLGWTLAVLLAGVILVVSAPVELFFRVERHEAWKASFRVRWLFGLVRFGFSPSGAERETVKKPKREKKAGGRFPRRLARAFVQPRVLWRAKRFVLDVLRAVRPRDLWLRARLGLGDPAETGMLWAFVGPVMAFIPARKLEITPEFFEETLDLDARGRVRIVPAQLAWLLVAFALSPAVLTAIWRRP